MTTIEQTKVFAKLPLSRPASAPSLWPALAPLHVMLMADLGADVIKIEVPEGGDPSRRMTVRPGMPSTFFETNNRAVKSVTLNLPQVRDAAFAVAEDLHLDVGGAGGDFFHVDLGPAERGSGLGLPSSSRARSMASSSSDAPSARGRR